MDKTFVVTIRRAPGYPMDEIYQRLLAHPDRCRQGAGFLLYTILDDVVDGYIPVAQAFLEHVESLEDVLFQAKADKPIPKFVLLEIFKQKKKAQQFRRAVIPMRDILNQIIRDDIDLFPEPDMVTSATCMTTQYASSMRLTPRETLLTALLKSSYL
jgi:magnesium transporter